MSGKVLVVEDDAGIRESLCEILEDQGYEARAAVDGLHAMRLLREGSWRPDAILLDMMMPVMDGRGFRLEQLANPDLANIPVVLLSAYRDVDGIATRLGVTSWLSKPVDLTALLAAVRNALAR